MEVKRSGTVLLPNNSRVLFRPFEPNDSQRVLKIIARVMERSDAEVEEQLEQVLAEFHGRHQRLTQFFLRRFETVKPFMITDRAISPSRRMLIGSYFTQEYTMESAALFNPSMVWHPDQSALPSGTKRFVMSLRATGEGHLSSLCFRSGTVDSSGTISVDPSTGYVTLPEVVPNSQYEKGLFQRKLLELGMSDGMIELVLDPLEDPFTLEQLDQSVRFVMRQHRSRQQDWDAQSRAIIALAKANYEIEYPAGGPMCERILFPYSPNERNGIEDARFVEFHEEDGSRMYYATYTAFDGSVTFPQLVETSSFERFRISTLNGPEVRNKGMALFPRRIHGSYAMLGRHDGENIYLMYSDMLHFWYSKQLLLKPTYPWEFVQLGNCGSPLETEAGWLVLSHGVGPMRKYAIGAFLLDRNDPSHVIGRLREPLLAPNENERSGYVPNVVYSCGAVIHHGLLVIPYAMSDYATTFCTVPVADLLRQMQP
jgi:predicted GH43/DUF377 family glycosyl hydrolase